MFDIRQLTKLYVDKVVFSDYANIFAHKRILISGPNGAGKSTLLAMLAGLEDYQSGSIELNKQIMAQTRLQACVAIASDKLVFPEFLKAEQVLGLTDKYRDCTEVAKLVRVFSFEPYMQTKVINLSSGNLKKLQLINAFMKNADVLLLDEPTAALEHKSLPILLNLITDFQGQVIVTSHEPEPFIQQGFQEQALHCD